MDWMQSWKRLRLKAALKADGIALSLSVQADSCGKLRVK